MKHVVIQDPKQTYGDIQKEVPLKGVEIDGGCEYHFCS